MIFFTRLKLSNADKRITRLLRESKFYRLNKDKEKFKLSKDDIDLSEPWIREVDTFISIVLSEKKYLNILKTKELTRQDIFDFYLLMTLATLPNPIFKTGHQRLSHTLVASAIYQNINKILIPCFQSIGKYHVIKEQQMFGHKYASEIMSFASELKFAHEMAYGKITLEEAL